MGNDCCGSRPRVIYYAEPRPGPTFITTQVGPRYPQFPAAPTSPESAPLISASEAFDARQRGLFPGTAAAYPYSRPQTSTAQGLEQKRQNHTPQTYEELMLNHIEYTIQVLEGMLPNSKWSEERKKESLAKLNEITIFWAHKLSSATGIQKQWIALLEEHIKWVAAYGTAVLSCPCKQQYAKSCPKTEAEQAAMGNIIANGKKVVDFLVALLGETRRDRISKFWSEHLDCTAKYIKTLKRVCGDTENNEYKRATDECFEFGRTFGQALDRWTEEKKSAAYA